MLHALDMIGGRGRGQGQGCLLGWFGLHTCSDSGHPIGVHPLYLVARRFLHISVWFRVVKLFRVGRNT
jgi:hypothetical protein